MAVCAGSRSQSCPCGAAHTWPVRRAGRALCHPDRVLAAAVRAAGRTSRSTRSTSKPASLEQRRATPRPASHASVIVVSPSGAADGQVEPPLVRVPVGALPDPGLALEPAAVRLPDVGPRSARRRRRRAARPARAARAPRASAASRSVVVVQVEVGAERAGDERDALGHRRVGGSRRAAGRPGSATPAASAVRAADLEHPGGGVDADHADARQRGRHGDPPGADAELDDRAAGRDAPPRRRSRRPR